MYDKKRGILNPIGELANILFGTLSQTDANYYNTEIKKLYADNRKLSTLIANETSILKTTLRDQEMFKLKITTFIQNLSNTTNVAIHKLETQELTLQYLLEFSEIVTEHSEMIENLRSLVTNGRQGKIDPILLNQEQVKLTLSIFKIEFWH